MNLSKAVLVAVFISTISLPTMAQSKMSDKGFWTLGTDKQWSAPELDKAFAVFIRLKETYGDQFNLVVQDLHKEGTPKPDGSKTAQIAIKIYVVPPNDKIEKELKSIGLVYVK